MNDTLNLHPPAALANIEQATRAAGFTMASDPLTGALLRTLAASKVGGSVLELGTGTGISAAWLLDGMDRTARLISVESEKSFLSIAKRHLAADARVTFHLVDGARYIEAAGAQRFDLIFADTWPGKFTHLDQTLDLLKPGGIYLIDDMHPQPNWPAEHPPRVEALIRTLEARTDVVLTKMNWSTGLILLTRKGEAT